MEESDFTFIVKFPPDFPLEDLVDIVCDLTRHGGIVPGYIPPSAGVLDIDAMKYSEILNETTIILPDRNIVSRIAAIAEDRAKYPLDVPSQFAVNLMAYCQCMNINFEPGVAFHELAHKEGNVDANRELTWFRAGDAAQALAWVDISRGRSNTLGLIHPAPLSCHDLAAPLGRWQRNYVVALKIAEIELCDMKPIDRALFLIDWMIREFFLAGPAALFASMYFSPISKKKRLIKSLRSPDRERAIEGIQNAAWDMTYLSEFARRVDQEGNGPRRFIFATGDIGLATIAKLIAIDAEPDELVSELERQMSNWWKSSDLTVLARRFAEAMSVASSRPPPASPVGIDDPIAELISCGEQKVRAWRGAGC